MENCKCSKEKELADIQERVREMEITNVERLKDIEYMKETLDKLNQTLEKLEKAIDIINSKPLQKYEKVAWMIISGLVAFILGRFLQG